MKKLISQNEFKYMQFLLLLFLTGICYYYRSDIFSFCHSIGNSFLVSYGEAIGVSENRPATQAQEGVSSGDVSGDNGKGQEGNETAAFAGQSDSEGETESWEFTTADESYFDDAVFIGDSRTVGLQEYAGLSHTTFYCSTGLTVYKLLSAPIVPMEGSIQKMSIEESLQKKQFGKIYLMIGINEMGIGDVDSFIQKYSEVVDRLQELQPNAVIYLESIMKVTSERSLKGDYINNEGIDARNMEIEKLADEKRIFYLDVNSSVCDANGDLDASFTFDGVHLKASYISLWKQYLQEHIVEFCNNK